ncbi:MAG: 1-acyl-sn-glycerol-3-phosphate acyltransferase [Treponema sp.]|nr:1-acyl-sn-glycerol-3-phosphate acyltransferase [Spirochaetia bacterium]MDY2840151.1 1-acyl-sn-glycerol-3-phosphate acyltransferase [Treponema sp.]MDY5123772.1 1-acyl-sn-glycerol-3-phosphate acyltransferase [Treponema sp.]
MNKIFFWISFFISLLVVAFWPGALNFIANYPYMIVPVVIGAFITVFIVINVLLWILLIVVSWTVNKNKEYKKQSPFYGKLFAALLSNSIWWCGARVVVTGMEKLPDPKAGRFLFVSNHRSVFDTFIQVAALWRYPMAFISKPENFKIPIGNQYMRRCRYMAINRDNPREGGMTLIKASEILKSGDSCIGVYPEGTRNRTTDTLLRFRHGCFKAALWAKCPIVIGVVHNSAKIRPNWPKTTKVHFEIVEVLPYEAIKGKKSNEISDIVRQKMLAHLDADDWTYDLKLKNIPQQEDAREQPKVESEHTDSVNDTDTSTGEN